jgi:hypothetical protein
VFSYRQNIFFDVVSFGGWAKASLTGVYWDTPCDAYNFKYQVLIGMVAASIKELGFRQVLVANSDMVSVVIRFVRCHVSAFISHFVQCDGTNICEINLYFLCVTIHGAPPRSEVKCNIFSCPCGKTAVPRHPDWKGPGSTYCDGGTRQFSLSLPVTRSHIWVNTARSSGVAFSNLSIHSWQTA